MRVLNILLFSICEITYLFANKKGKTPINKEDFPYSVNFNTKQVEHNYILYITIKT